MEQPVPEPQLEAPQPILVPREDVSPRPEIGILVNNITASVNSLAEHLARSEKASASFSRLAKLLTTHARNASADARGKQFSGSLAQLSKQLASDQALLARQISSMKKRLAQIHTALTIVPHDPLSYASTEFAPGDEQFNYSLHAGPTETAVSTDPASQDGAPGTVVHEATLDGEEDEANVLPEDRGSDTGFVF
jgi:hypothetical protein